MNLYDIDEVLSAITLPDVFRGLADLIEGTISHGHDGHPQWVWVHDGAEYGARPMISFAARHCKLRVPIGSLDLHGATDQKCRERLGTLGFKFTKK